jgi:hypothetical protein
VTRERWDAEDILHDAVLYRILDWQYALSA